LEKISWELKGQYVANVRLLVWYLNREQAHLLFCWNKHTAGLPSIPSPLFQSGATLFQVGRNYWTIVSGEEETLL
jgi:hypothetical protein